MRMMVGWDLAVMLGCDPAISRDRVQVTTASGIEFAPRFRIESIEARQSASGLSTYMPHFAGIDEIGRLARPRLPCGGRLIIDFRIRNNQSGLIGNSGEFQMP